jgi:ABC-type lipoprotein export system ATPase subunit
MSIIFTAPPTVAEWMNSAAFVRLIVGPVGSGKTTGLLMEILRRAIEQAPGPDGIRRTRWAVVRQTLSQLKMTVLLDLLSWFRYIASYKVSEQIAPLFSSAV